MQGRHAPPQQLQTQGVYLRGQCKRGLGGQVPSGSEDGGCEELLGQGEWVGGGERKEALRGGGCLAQALPPSCAEGAYQHSLLGVV